MDTDTSQKESRVGTKSLMGSLVGNTSDREGKLDKRPKSDTKGMVAFLIYVVNTLR